ncbi:MAG: UDP-glucose/GDP-mannose dehydrogenase family protein [Actinomycetota bacterium]|nr:UDP-glucose/GDP-mannose dehydrogenase family protein [Actinomycetota bacterium]
MQIGIIGTGHVGLITAVTFAELGHQVIATDNDDAKVQSLLNRKAPFYEPGLQELLESGLDSGRLQITNDPAGVGRGAEVIFICVGTPPKASGEASLIAVEASARSVAPHFQNRVVVVEKSTVPAGTSRHLARVLKHARPDMGDDIQVASNPEFLREGHAIRDSLEPDRILVGTDTEWATEVMRRVYKPLTDRGHELIETDIVTAELSKHACNAFLALKISYANAMARLCERAGADISAVADIMGKDQRIGRAFLNAGLGYGGFCFPKDLAAFERLSDSLGYEFPLLREIARINEEALETTVKRIVEALWNLEGKRIAVLGLAFKPDTDDTRLSPALSLVQRLLDQEAKVVGYDPAAGHNAKAEIPELEIASDPYDAARGAHCLVLATEWEEFTKLDFDKVKELMEFPVVVDGRNALDPEAVVAAGLSYYPAGRPPVLQPFER